jgi:hypothetical protein
MSHLLELSAADENFDEMTKPQRAANRGFDCKSEKWRKDGATIVAIARDIPGARNANAQQPCAPTVKRERLKIA